MRAIALNGIPVVEEAPPPRQEWEYIAPRPRPIAEVQRPPDAYEHGVALPNGTNAVVTVIETNGRRTDIPVHLDDDASRAFRNGHVEHRQIIAELAAERDMIVCSVEARVQHGDTLIRTAANPINPVLNVRAGDTVRFDIH